MVNGHSLGRKVFLAVNAVFLGLVAVLSVLPLLHVFFSSISDPTKLFVNRNVVLWPLGAPTLRGYELVLHNKKILTGYVNTIVYVTSATLLGVFLTTIAGYVLSRKNLLFRNALMFFVTFTMMFSGGLIPFYLVVKGLGWLDTRLAVIVPACLSVFNIIIMRTSMLSIPDSLEESAKLDGAGHFMIFARIILPLSKAAVAVMFLFYAVSQWNSWFGAAIFLQTKSLFPLQLILREILVQSNVSNIMQGTNLSSAQISQDLYKLLVQHCTTIVATVPILFVYPFVQRYFVTGVMIGSLKG
jgi:putative aldouronate transport system permease protein